MSHDYTDLFDGKIDLALRRGPLPELESLGARAFGRTTLVTVAAPDLPVPAGRPHEIAGALPWIRVGPRLEPQALQLGQQSTTVRPVLAVDSQRLAVDLALRGCGVTRANWFFVREHIARKRLREVLPESRATAITYAVYPRRSRPSPLVKRALEAITQEARALDIWDDGEL